MSAVSSISAFWGSKLHLCLVAFRKGKWMSLKPEACSTSDAKHSPGGRFPLFSKDGQMLHSSDFQVKSFPILDCLKKNCLVLGSQRLCSEPQCFAAAAGLHTPKAVNWHQELPGAERRTWAPAWSDYSDLRQIRGRRPPSAPSGAGTLSYIRLQKQKAVITQPSGNKCRGYCGLSGRKGWNSP